MTGYPYRSAEVLPTMSERVESALSLLEIAAHELRQAADEGPERSVWAAEIKATAKCVETIARAIKGWIGRR